MGGVTYAHGPGIPSADSIRPPKPNFQDKPNTPRTMALGLGLVLGLGQGQGLGQWLFGKGKGKGNGCLDINTHSRRRAKRGGGLSMDDLYLWDCPFPARIVARPPRGLGLGSAVACLLLPRTLSSPPTRWSRCRWAPPPPGFSGAVAALVPGGRAGRPPLGAPLGPRFVLGVPGAGSLGFRLEYA